MDKFREWNKTFRQLLITATELEPAAVLMQGQNTGLVTGDKFLTYFLASAIAAPDAFRGDGNFSLPYTLEYTVSFYDLAGHAEAMAQAVQCLMQTQGSRDILQPAGMTFKDFTTLVSFSEPVNARIYRRCDCKIFLAALYHEKVETRIEHVKVCPFFLEY